MFDNNVYVEHKCPFCGKYHKGWLSEADYVTLQNEKSMQNAFSFLSTKEKKILVTGICPNCWDEMFSPKKEEKKRR